jgi:signal peptidase I
MNPRWQSLLKEYVEALAVAVILALVIRSSVIQAFKIPSGSMLETLQIGDHLLVNKFLYGLKLPFTNIVVLPVSDPGFQDVIVFEFPEDPTKDFIKRVIGLPGDTVEIKDKILYRNGVKVDEPYTQFKHPDSDSDLENFGPITVPEGKYFCMGDNRDESYDSRRWGFVDRSKIRGKAWRIYWSWGDSPISVRWGRIGMAVK